MSQLAAIESRIATLRIAKAETWKLYNDQKKEFLALGRARRALIQANSTTVRDLPTEVLSKIFEAAICVKDFDHKTDIQRNVLRRVCSRWNETILAEPKFWTNIFIQLVEEDVVYDNEDFDQPILCCTQKEAFNRVRMRMKRGGDLLKHLRLVHPCLQPDPLDSAEPPPPELAKLLRQVKNWGSVYIDLEEYFDFVFEIFNSDSPDPSPRAVWPRLESLELRTSVDLVPPGMEDVDILLPDDIENHFATSPKARVTATAFPSLKHVSLDLGKRNLLQWELPWSQLTSLRLKCFANPVFIYLGILEKCPSLEDLYILADLPNHAKCLPSSADFKSHHHGLQLYAPVKSMHILFRPLGAFIDTHPRSQRLEVVQLCSAKWRPAVAAGQQISPFPLSDTLVESEKRIARPGVSGDREEQYLSASEISQVLLCLRQREINIEIGAREEELGKYAKECSRVIQQLSTLHQENRQINRTLYQKSQGLSMSRPLDFLAYIQRKITQFLIHFPVMYDIRRIHQPALNAVSCRLRAIGSAVYRSRSLSSEIFDST
ncbi:hypothetical protein NMY22_g11591 [Coprinellus aureogranulatus]|nr:hypothetical protein NMY22_g11591 [Coprinellus aureogranulatus]